MKLYKFKSLAVISVYIISLGAIVASLFLIGKSLSLNNPLYDNLSYVYRGIIDNGKPVINYQNETITMPYENDEVTVLKGYYDMAADSKIQENTLIYYANTYLPNTGILYSNKSAFEVLCVLDGTVEEIITDETMGNIVTIKHSNNLRTIYQSLNEVSVLVGDTIKQGDVIGTSGSNKIDTQSDYMLLFEVEYNGTNINPDTFYQMDLKELS